MPKHDFTALFEKYPSVIDRMGGIFTSHEFILRLARQNQTLYIDALDSYRHEPAPFKIVHAILARHLHAYRTSIELVRLDASSTNIFGQPSQCSEWRRLQ